jgi:hypothetical protein
MIAPLDQLRHPLAAAQGLPLSTERPELGRGEKRVAAGGRWWKTRRNQ